jgi:hypothetical protein
MPSAKYVNPQIYVLLLKLCNRKIRDSLEDQLFSKRIMKVHRASMPQPATESLVLHKMLSELIPKLGVDVADMLGPLLTALSAPHYHMHSYQ